MLGSRWRPGISLSSAQGGCLHIIDGLNHRYPSELFMSASPTSVEEAPSRAASWKRLQRARERCRRFPCQAKITSGPQSTCCPEERGDGPRGLRSAPWRREALGELTPGTLCRPWRSARQRGRCGCYCPSWFHRCFACRRCAKAWLRRVQRRTGREWCPARRRRPQP